jgi:hypothetical protein
MIYTCYEMARDCRADKPEGWSYFISHYVPVIRKLFTHYRAAGLGLEDVLKTLRRPDSILFQSADPSPERWLVAELRQLVVAQIRRPDAEIPLDLETVAAALEPLTVVEKQAAWLETMDYDAARTGAMLRMAPATVEKIRARGAELIRGKSDAWRASILRDNGLALGRAAAVAATKDCSPVRDFLDVIDGRTTWPKRERMTAHVTACWHCVDHFCRMVEVVELLRGLKPLSDEEAEPYRKLLGVAAPKRPKRWLHLFGGG